MNASTPWAEFQKSREGKEYPEYYDNCSVLLEFENGIIGSVSGEQIRKIRVRLKDGDPRYGRHREGRLPGREQWETVTADRQIRMDSVDSWQTLFRDAYVKEAEAFTRCILNDTEPEVTGHDGKMALVLVNEGLKSILEKRPIDIVI